MPSYKSFYSDSQCLLIVYLAGLKLEGLIGPRTQTLRDIVFHGPLWPLTLEPLENHASSARLLTMARVQGFDLWPKGSIELYGIYLGLKVDIWGPLWALSIYTIYLHGPFGVGVGVCFVFFQGSGSNVEV